MNITQDILSAVCPFRVMNRLGVQWKRNSSMSSVSTFYFKHQINLELLSVQLISVGNDSCCRTAICKSKVYNVCQC